ncbi:MAG: cupin domain-containing protein [Shewanellaceae bacterium]|nr:cupin domain-containing protein [Shewanellaceae bacterium]
MMTLTLNPDAFLANYWQQKPLFLTKGIRAFEDPLQADELAGMALESCIQSRIIRRQDEQWETQHGPFTEDYFSTLGDSHWQLLVHATNHWVPECQDIVDLFRFLPDWRIDDLMISYAAPEGGVGAHIDQYDVFILQGQGRRRWRVGHRGNYQAAAGNGLDLIESFEPCIDVVMEPGDLLYIPAGCPHYGQALEPAISYSLGLRTPSQQELLSHLSAHLINHEQGQTHYVSTKNDDTNVGVISTATHTGLVELMQQIPDSIQRDVLGRLLSQSGYALNLEPMPAAEQILDLRDLPPDTHLERIGGLKIICHEHDDLPRFFVDGQCYPVDDKAQSMCFLLANLKTYPPAVLEEIATYPQLQQQVLALINQGYLVINTD